jgi:putative membrane protein
MQNRLSYMLFAALWLVACNNKPGTTATAVSTTDTIVSTSVKDTATVAKTEAPHGTAEMSDTAFLATAYNTGVFEIKASKLAKRMTEHKKVKEFANMIIKDHEAMDSNVVTMLTARGAAIPTDLPADLKARMKELNEYMGKDFEQRYAQANIDGHKKAIDLFTNISKYSKDEAVRKLAADALPYLMKHETDADSLMVFINTPRKW